MRTMFHTRHRKLTPEERIDLRKLLDRSPELAAAYQFSQRILSVHEKKHLTSNQARKRVLKAWAALSDVVKRFFPKYSTAITERSHEYFSNWDEGARTNGVTEALNRGLRNLQRAGRGLTFDELRRRAIYTVSATERIRRSRLGLPTPIEKAEMLADSGNTLKLVRTVRRHGLHISGRQRRKSRTKQLTLFPDKE